MSKISGPLLDRIDLHVEVPSLGRNEIEGRGAPEASEKIRERVRRARKIQKKRFRGNRGIFCNAQISGKSVKKYCSPDAEGNGLLNSAIDKLGLSARAYDRVLKMALTIADLENSPSINSAHIAEAIGYRSLDKKFYV